MSAPVFILSPETIQAAPGGLQAGAELALTGPEARHAIAVRRLRAGERLDLVDGAGLRLSCTVTDVGTGTRDRLGARIIERTREPDPPVRLTLIQALAKGGRDEQAVETATEVGVETVLPWQAARCISVWQGARRDRGRQRWSATAREAAKQARRAVIPRVEAPATTGELAAWVSRAVAEGGVVALLHEQAAAPLADLPSPVRPGTGDPHQRPVLAVVVGPEGGIGEEETAALERAGARAVRLGPHIMRTASAGPVALAVLAQRTGLWG